MRGLAGVASADRPLFLKAVYNGTRALEEPAAYDPAGLTVGIPGAARAPPATPSSWSARSRDC